MSIYDRGFVSVSHHRCHTAIDLLAVRHNMISFVESLDSIGLPLNQEISSINYKQFRSITNIVLDLLGVPANQDGEFDRTPYIKTLESRESIVGTVEAILKELKDNNRYGLPDPLLINHIRIYKKPS